MPSCRSTSRTKSKSTNTLREPTQKTIPGKLNRASPYGPNFERKIIDHGIYPSHYVHPDGTASRRPNNEEEILDALGQPRSSLSPSRFPDSAFDEWVHCNDTARSEDMMRTAYPIMAGDTKIPSEMGKLLNNFKPLVDGPLTIPRPDAHDGANPSQINLRVRQELAEYIIPSTQQEGPALPNFFTAAKGRSGSADVATRQACYNGALGARAMHSIQNYGMDGSKKVYDNNAYSISSTYHDGTLKLYTTHPTPPADSKSSPEYHTALLDSYAMTGRRRKFREGVGAFRNARDWAKKRRDELITSANSRATEPPACTHADRQMEPTSASFSRSRALL